MPFVAVPLTVKLIVTGHQAGADWVNIFHVDCDSAAGPTDVTYLATQVLSNYQTRFGPFISSACTIESCEAVALDSSSAPAAIHTASVAGGGSSTAAPQNATGLISWHVATRYRGGHSRSYIPGLSASAIATGNTLASGYVAGMQTAATGFLADLNGLTPPTCAPVDMSVVHYKRAHAPLIPPLTETVVAATVSSRPGSQRRRIT